MIVIIGAGLAGLSVAYHLAEKGIEYVLYERESEPGGLCRSYAIKNHTFDYAGHFLHVRTEEVKNLLKKIMPSGLSLRKRNAAILIGDSKIPFPFQAHLGFLPDKIVLDCLAGYIHSLVGKRSQREKTFGKWLKANFGDGMYRIFFEPYNQKFWKCDLDKIMIDWTDWSVPRPEIEEIVGGALKIENPGLGYNPEYYYPIEGGIGAFISALASNVKGMTTNSAVIEVISKDRKIILSDGEEVKYDYLINTKPLPKFLATVKDVPAAILRGAAALEWIVLDCIQLGFRRENIIEEDWIYIPEKKYPFHRVGKYPGSKTDVGTALFVEFTRRKMDPILNAEEMINTAIEGLTELKIIEKREKSNVSEMVPLTPAYVVYDKHRQWFLPRAQVYLERHNILSIGRYGAWEYSAMEDAILAGKIVAESLAK